MKGILAQQASKKATKGFNQTTSLIFISETAPFSFCLGWSFNLFQSCAIDTLSPAVDNIWPALTSNVSFMTRFGEATLSKNRWLRTNIIFPPPSFSLRKWNKSAFYHFPCLHPCLCPHHREMFRFDSTPSNSWRILYDTCLDFHTKTCCASLLCLMLCTFGRAAQVRKCHGRIYRPTNANKLAGSSKMFGFGWRVLIENWNIWQCGKTLFTVFLPRAISRFHEVWKCLHHLYISWSVDVLEKYLRCIKS